MSYQSKLHRITTVLLRALITQMIIFNQATKNYQQCLRKVTKLTENTTEQKHAVCTVSLKQSEHKLV